LARQRPIQHLEITTFVHATEDHVKVVKAVSNLLSGVFGDELKMLKWVLKNRRPATSVLDKVFQELSSIDSLELLESLETRIDKNKNLYIRLDKQKAFRGVTQMEKRDPIRLKARLLVPHKADPVKLMFEYIQELRQDV
jgi:RNA binding exosome subunit